MILLLVVFVFVPATSFGESVVQDALNSELQNPSNKVPDKAYLLVFSDTSWSGSIQDSEFDSASHDGSGNKKIEVTCLRNGFYSTVMQKQTDRGFLQIAMIQDGKLLGTKYTKAEYGLVSLAGECYVGITLPVVPQLTPEERCDALNKSLHGGVSGCSFH
jgi:hypothetical protein